MRFAPPVRLCLVAALFGAGALSGCRPGTALHSRYNNFRAYYNTYYNATRSLDSGEEALQRQAVTLDRNALVSVFPATTAGSTSGPFQDAIDKSAELLRNRPTSKWADDALLVIGKAYFYQRNFAGAEQKFRETLAAAEAAGDRRLGDEARFWLGRTFAAADRFEEGVTVLEEGLASEGGDRRWTARMQLALGELYARAERWDEAAEALLAGAPAEGDADVAARAYVLLGQVEEHTANWDEAAAAYAEALSRKPAYELGYAARVNRALVIGLSAERPAEGLQIIRDMRGDDKNYERRGELALVEARLRAAAGEPDRAYRLFRSVLYDEELNGRSVAGEAHYRLGEFYRDQRDDFVRASAHFDSAATVVRAPAPEVRPAAGALLRVTEQARVYATLASAARQIAETDSLLALGALSEADFQARIASIEAERLRVYREEQRRLQAARTAAAFSGSGGGSFDDGGEGVVQPGRGTGATAGTPGTPGQGGDVGFLSYRSPTSVQAGLIAFEQTWGDRPLVPNWRRRAAAQAGDIAAARGVVGTETGGFEIGEGPPPLDMTRVPRTPEKRSELITDLASLRYELANAFFLSLGRADTAAALYRSILADTPTLPVAVRAQYALAEIERAAGRDDAARPYYEAVAAADTLALGRASRIRLGLEPPDAPAETEPAAPDASPAYVAARARWAAGDVIGAATDLVALGDANPDAAGAPRAYLGAAIALLEWADGDTLRLARPLPDSLQSPLLRAIADSVSRGEVVRAAPARQAPAARRAPRVEPERRAPEVLEEIEERVLDTGKRLPGRARQETAAAQRPTPPAQPEPEAADPAPVEAGAPPEAATATPEEAVPPPTLRAVPVDSTTFTLRHHLQALAARYAQTPYAARANALVAGLPAPAVDTVASPVPPVPPAADPAEPAADSLAAGPPQAIDTAPEAADAFPETGPLLEAPGLRGADPVEAGGDGYTWQVRSLSIPSEGGAMLGVLTGAGYRAAIVRDAGGGAYAIVIGQFASEAAASAAQDALPAWAQLRGRVVPLADYEAIAGAGVDDERPADDF
ncbi:SPOR domain-containing protein [Rubrivirga sp. IMCC45206]|uniref:SPOR domain-containing protein n=1 Tax=Rubrivirga sp. IMCC45206 TaxID=3391614 RepID=UPI00398FB6D8